MDARAEASRPPKTSTYLAVEDLPPPNAKPVMTVDERSKLKTELIALREKRAAAAKAQDTSTAQATKP
jgi:hypothetical protein